MLFTDCLISNNPYVFKRLCRCGVGDHGDANAAQKV